VNGLVRTALAALLLVGLGSPLYAQAPWSFNNPPPPPAAEKPRSLLGDVFEGLVTAYRKNEAATTIRRCSFQVTCSLFAEKAVSRYGFVIGGVLFVDRYFYRENQDSRNHYPLIGEPDGTYRLDDSPFVP
jgi:hypothetical protein